MGVGEVMLPFDPAREHTTGQMAHQVLLSGPDTASVRDLVDSSAGAVVSDRQESLAAQQSERELNAWVNYLLLGVISAYIAIAVVNTLVMATGERFREFALLRVVGTTRRQLLAMLRWEALFIGGLALVVGGIGVLIAIVPFSAVMAGTLIPYVPPLVGLGIVAFTLLVTLAVMLVPARIALRTPPTEALTGPR